MAHPSTLHRIQIVIALVMILSLLVGSPAAQAKVYGPGLPTSASDNGLLTDNDSGRGPTIEKGEYETVTFANGGAGKTVLAAQLTVKGRRTSGSTTTLEIRKGNGDSLSLSTSDWQDSFRERPFSTDENENNPLRTYLEDSSSSAQFRLHNASSGSGTRNLVIDWAKLTVTTAEPSVAPPEIVGSCSPANIHLVVDNSASISSANMNTLKANLKSFMSTIETAIPDTNWMVTKFSGSSASSMSSWATSGLATANSFVDGMQLGTYTPTAKGIQQALNKSIPSGTGALPKIMIILTDGAPNRRLSDSSGSTRYYYQGAIDAIAQADAARTAGWTTYLVAIGPGDSDAPSAPYAANVNIGLAGSAANVLSTNFGQISADLLGRLASGCLIDLEKSVDQEVVLPGTTVQYTYVVSNPMTVNLTNIRLSDDKCSAISSRTVISGDGDSTLEPSEVWQYTCSQAINANTTNTAVVTGTIASTGTDVTDTDTATVTTLEPGAGSLAAFKFHDYDMDGKWDGGEPAIED